MADARTNAIPKDNTPQGSTDDYHSLPAPGETDPAKLAILRNIFERFGAEAGVPRGDNIGLNSESLKWSTSLYRFGDQAGELAPRRIFNRTRQALDSFESAATSQPPSMVLKVISQGADGPWVMTTDFTLAGAELVDPITQKPLTDPATGQPFPDQNLKIAEEFPDALLDFIPAHRRVRINGATVIKWEQPIFDAIRRRIGYDETIRQKIHNKMQVGWIPEFYWFDQFEDLPHFAKFPPEQWFLDPLKHDVKAMSRARVDIVGDASELSRIFPQAADAIIKSGSMGLKYAPGNMGYDEIYTGMVNPAMPLATVGVMWVRNVPVLMGLKESVGEGLVDVADDGQKITMGDHDLSDSFDDAGKPVTGDALHPAHPRRFAVMEFLVVDQTVVPGSWREVRDIPVSLDRNSESLWGPYGDPETLFTRGPQIIMNDMYIAITDHAEWFKGPAIITTNELMGGMKDGERFASNAFNRPNETYTVDGSLVLAQNGKLADHFFVVNPPQLPPALPETLNIVRGDWEKTFHASVSNGTPPSAGMSGRAIESLQAAAQNGPDLKSTHTERAIQRDARFWLHDELFNMKLSTLMTYNQSLPAEVVQKWIMPLRRKLVIDVDVSMANGAAMVNQRRAQKALSLWGADKAIDNRTLLEECDIDPERVDNNRRDEAENQARNQSELARFAPPPAPPAPKASITVAAKLEMLSPQIQQQILQESGLSATQAAPAAAATIAQGIPPAPSQTMTQGAT